MHFYELHFYVFLINLVPEKKTIIVKLLMHLDFLFCLWLIVTLY